MVSFFCPPPPLVKSSGFSLEYVGLQQPANASSTSISVTGVPIGREATGRVVILAVHTLRPNSGSPVTSATIGGVSATIVNQSNASNSVGVCLLYAVVPTGTTATVDITFSAAPSASGVRFGVYSLYGASSASPYSSVVGASGGDATRSVSLSTPAGGCVIIAATGTNSSAISGATSTDYTYTGGGSEVGKAGRFQPTVLSASVSFSTITRHIIAASWR